MHRFFSHLLLHRMFFCSIVMIRLYFKKLILRDKTRSYYYNYSAVLSLNLCGRESGFTMKIGLVLEGGGLRGLYTAGVLDVLMEQGIQADYVIGVSAGAGNGVSYVSRQLGRNRRINTEYLKDKRYLSFSSFIKTKSLFGMDFIFDEIPNRLDPFDKEAFFASTCEFCAGVTDVRTGKPVYFGKDDLKQDFTVLRASASLPIFSPIVEYKQGKYLDGGMSDPIPAQRALKDGCDRLIIVLTRERSYVKQPEKFRAVYRRQLRDYPAMIDALDHRHELYNRTLETVRSLEKERKALVIAPQTPPEVSRFERNKQKLLELCEKGRSDTLRLLPQITTFIQK